MEFAEGEVEETDYVIPADKLYAVVELVVDVPNDDESDVQIYSCVAASIWLSDVIRRENENGQARYYATVKWPKNEAKLNTLLEKRSKPGGGKDWVTYESTRVLKFCRSLGVAKEQATKALEMSLSESDGNNNQMPKRSSLQPMRFGNSLPTTIIQYAASSDSDAGSRPPPLKLKIMDAKNTTTTSSPNRKRPSPFSETGVSSATVVSIESVGDGSKSDTHQVKELQSVQEVSQPHNNPPKSCGKNEGSSVLAVVSSPSTTNITSSSSQILPNNPVPDKNNTGSSSKISPSNSVLVKRQTIGATHGIQYTLLKEIQEIKETMSAMSLLMSKIYNFVCPAIDVESSTTVISGRPGLPLDSFEAMTNWELFLRDSDNCLHAVVLLAERCVLTTLKDSVYNMMKFMFSNKLGCSFNGHGKNKANCKIKKAAFDVTRSYSALNAALKRFSDLRKRDGMQLTYSHGEPDVAPHVASWLKDAPKRMLTELKKSHVLADDVTSLPLDCYLIVPDTFLDGNKK